MLSFTAKLHFTERFFKTIIYSVKMYRLLRLQGEELLYMHGTCFINMLNLICCGVFV